MRISDWSSDVCSSDLGEAGPGGAPNGDLYVDVQVRPHPIFQREGDDLYCEVPIRFSQAALGATINVPTLDGTAEIRVPEETQRSEEHTSELQSLMRISYAVFCLKKKKNNNE